MFKKILPLAFALVTMGAMADGAKAQTALTNGVSINTGAITGSFTSINLGSTAGTGAVTMPLSVSYGGVSTDWTLSRASFQKSGSYNNPSPGQNFLSVGTTGSATLMFSSAQAFFTTRWGTPDAANTMSFYNGSQLLASVTGTQFSNIAGVALGGSTANAAFNFSELGYDRVVMSTAGNVGFEVGSFGFSDQQVAVAPIPLNAASLGGLLSFLMMLAARGKGGTQVAVRMAFASLMPRRRMLA